MILGYSKVVRRKPGRLVGERTLDFSQAVSWKKHPMLFSSILKLKTGKWKNEGIISDRVRSYLNRFDFGLN